MEAFRISPMLRLCVLAAVAFVSSPLESFAQLSRVGVSVEAIVGRQLVADRLTVFGQIWDRAFAAAQLTPPVRREPPRLSRAAIPDLNEPWYC